MQTGKLIVLTGPSGVGKGTLVKSLLERHPELVLSISMTTRCPRPGEVEGESYYFVDRNKFQQMIETQDLLEWAEFAGNFYGTPRLPVIENIKQGKLVLLEIEVQGARQIKQTFSEALLIFILPPSMTELEKRLRDRGHDSEEAIVKRLERAIKEMEAAGEFDVQLMNDNLEIALQNLEKVLFD
ncbi:MULTISPECIES: guanylate kinase [Okeania]|uniref:Guanylate kinase n=1 Tax=Okeania hirsuta TaxID=1458930 RepID=A0A3N6NRE4_9CYAN|nr:MULTISPECIES: guanylate kinase [Okeania]NET14774.1 guanylate kinase [Okeania sp. SIO1H6]NEP75095.1 guanylate kinase [Okeania sp. SIO2G5]NEP96157.1 guanylate kinase [Okeania sp. SIO2F5]NEQ94153.1 guanylate kinase [Okeania sp. SIO2G4]NES76477.1 guanylate kinase [Okeania sp. SIO1H4]